MVATLGADIAGVTTEIPALRRRRHPGWAWLVAGHAAAVALVVSAFIHVSPDGGGNANIGAGLLLMPLWLLGLPGGQRSCSSARSPATWPRWPLP